mmetsp:Transcript_129163/g.306502  ORF Transcript_129163/g.306502 Transcript_129163/m.306502 type:complete len:477 (+) Transcript_129163:85-1515(+)|eukprot:CAMPEP_0181460070 /NCGR_PEP_ID=MMETSP1110-20121109/33150_1 /TAXON_ID=174948 /ORGANISM="Symbiodinium sp., Strain CCMP421" /LENGTH=476 /DNA_ID=CAMNT_0023584607 /DNA_START=68 /DNA_END=1498 /DNA_ORIENTATION=-
MSSDSTFLTAGAGEAGQVAQEVTVLAERPNLSLAKVRTAEAQELSERRVRLLKDAHLRAEQQVAVRNTMLELADELDRAAVRRRELEQAMVQEQLQSAKLQEELATWPEKLQKVRDKWEALRVETVTWGIRASAREGAAFPLLLTLATEWRPIGERRSVTGKPLSDEESMKVDRLLLKEMLKSWYALVTEPGPARRSSVHLQEVEAKKEEHQSLAKLLEEEREKNKALQKELIAKEEEVKAALRRTVQLEDEKLAIMRQGEREKAELRKQMQALQEALDKVPAELEKKEQVIIVLRQEVQEEKENVIRVKEDAEEDRLKLLAKIQALADELQNALTSAKHMKEAAVKASQRQPGSCISPEKFAQLIMELEELRDQMKWIGTDRDSEKEAINSLRLQLTRNRRRWELERQFLPLLHQVKGPVGPPSKAAKKEAPWATQSAVVLARAPEEMRPRGGSSGAVNRNMASTNGFRGVRALT